MITFQLIDKKYLDEGIKLVSIIDYQTQSTITGKDKLSFHFSTAKEFAINYNRKLNFQILELKYFVFISYSKYPVNINLNLIQL